MKLRKYKDIDCPHIVEINFPSYIVLISLHNYRNEPGIIYCNYYPDQKDLRGDGEKWTKNYPPMLSIEVRPLNRYIRELSGARCSEIPTSLSLSCC